MGGIKKSEEEGQEEDFCDRRFARAFDVWLPFSVAILLTVVLHLSVGSRASAMGTAFFWRDMDNSSWIAKSNDKTSCRIRRLRGVPVCNLAHLGPHFSAGESTRLQWGP